MNNVFGGPGFFFMFGLVTKLHEQCIALAGGIDIDTLTIANASVGLDAANGASVGQEKGGG